MLGARAQIVAHADIQENATTGSFEINRRLLDVCFAACVGAIQVFFGRKDLELISVVVQQSDCVSNHHVGEFEDRLVDHLV